MLDIQKKVDEVFRKNFGYTPFSERMKDIQNEFLELMKWQGVSNLKEELGDLLASCIKLASESEWDAEELIKNTLNKIEKRHLQYKSLGRKYKVAILGGAFDPITNGHIEVAKFVLNTSGEFDEVWLLPAYKHMYNKPMEDAHHRIEMCKLAAKVDRRIKVWDFEISNQLSGETYNLFKRIKEDPITEQYQFSMIIGMDNALTFDKWVNFEELERMARFIIIPRKGIQMDPKVNWFLKEPHIFLNNENNIPEISSTVIRELLKKGNKEKILLKYINSEVYNYIWSNVLYDIQEKTNI